MVRIAASTRAALVAVAAVLVLAAPAAGRTPSVRFASVPRHAVQGGPVAVTVQAPRSARCSLAVRYHDGSLQPGLGVGVWRAGRAIWRWTVPTAAKPGPARLAASCGRAGKATRTLTVVGAVIPPHLTVQQQGYSIRPLSTGGSTVSYGLLIANDSQTEDALDISVLVNFVDPSGHLFGSATTRIAAISPGQTYALGNSLSFPGAAPVVRLEPVIQVGSHARAAQRYPEVSNAHLVPSTFEPEWVGSVEGEVANTQQDAALQSAQLSAVVFDAAGNVIGAREFFKLTSGFRAVPFDRAASVMVSMQPRWKQLGA
jgi:hypothetical protein